MEKHFLNVSGFVKESITDGPGIRFTIFCQGCPHKCKNCHNPQTWVFENKELIDIDDIFDMITSNPLIKGVTFSGGEPFCQGESYGVLGKKLREKNYEVAAYSGYTFEQLLNGTDAQKFLLENIDVLVDGPFIEEQKDFLLSFRGSANQRILDVAKSLNEGKAILYDGERWQGAPRYVPKFKLNI